MFGNEIRYLESRIRNLEERVARRNRILQSLEERLSKSLALTEKLYNAIDKKNTKIRALQYQIANPGSEPVETISVPARGLEKHEIFIGE
jgi:uncharacterized coiled-coil protein SlyX